VLREDDGSIIAAAIVQWVITDRLGFAVLEDLSVDPGIRSKGLGALMIQEVEAEARRRNMDWVFLESGKDNIRAHVFFERSGFAEISHVFAKKL
jgi:GNAT superfamily N-acetyltransferase